MRRYLEKYLRGKRTIWWRIRKRKRKEKEEIKSKEKKKKNNAWEKKRNDTSLHDLRLPTVKTRRSKRQSWSMRYRLRVGTEIRIFH